MVVATYADELPQPRPESLPAWLTAAAAEAPAGTPAAAVQQIAATVRKAVAQPDFVKGVAAYGMAAHATKPTAMSAQLRQETEFWRIQVRKTGFTAES